MESPRSLIARVREERAKERQWQKATAQRKKKYQDMAQVSSLAQQEGQLTTAALTSHNTEKVKKARLQSFAKRGLLRRENSSSRNKDGGLDDDDDGATTNTTSVPSGSEYTYADTLSRIETGSCCSAVPLSLLGAIPSSTAAGGGTVTPSCSLLVQRLSARKKKRLSNADELPEVQEGDETQQQQGTSSSCSTRPPSCSTRPHLTRPTRMTHLVTDDSVAKNYAAPPRPPKPWEMDSHMCTSTEGHHSKKEGEGPTTTVSKSVNDFLALEREAEGGEDLELSPGNEGQNKMTTSFGDAPPPPAVFSTALLPDIHQNSSSQSSAQQPIRMNLPPPRPMDMVPPSSEEPKKKKVEATPTTTTTAALLSKKPPSIPRGTTAPQSKSRVASLPAIPRTRSTLAAGQRRPQGQEREAGQGAPRGIVRPFLKRAVSAKRVGVSNIERNSPGKEGGDQKGTVQVQVFRPGAFGREQERQRGVRFNMTGHGGDVFTAPDGVQFNVQRSLESMASVNSSGNTSGFAAALRMAQLPPTAGGGGFLFGAPRPDLFQEDGDEETTSYIPSDSYAQSFDDHHVLGQDDNDELPLDLVDDDENEEVGEGELPSASSRPDDVIPTGFSMEEKALMAALSKINKKEKEKEVQKQQRKEIRSAAPVVSPRTVVQNATLPVSMHQPTPKKRRQAGGRRHIGVQPL